MRGLTCDVVDLRFSSDARLRRYRTLVVPPFVRPPLPAIAARLRNLAQLRIAIRAQVPNQLGSGIAVLAGPDATFGVAANWSNAPRRFGGVTWTGIGSFDVPPFTVAPRDARLIVLGGGAPPATDALPRRNPNPVRVNEPSVALNASQSVHVALPAVAPGIARVTVGSAFGSGDRTVTLANDRVVAIFVPGGGARLVVFAARNALPYNAVNATGALRDDVLRPPPPSTTDRIAKYTHTYPAGTFNRAYRTQIVRATGAEAVVRFTYDAPDLGGGAHFEKTVRLAAGATRLVVDERVSFDGAAPDQRAVTLSALQVPATATVTTSPAFIAWTPRETIVVSWPPAAVTQATWTRYGSDGTLALVASPGTLRSTYALAGALTLPAAQALATTERQWLAAHPSPA